ncbi:hypothetical protein BG015_001701 [Linnemannia schmuckeri]|uniref:Uncharacterized protein n=1 Tax=Linnemannia schmuckeri TaxID=64567 RepID=A0A9P5RRX0_9FUNG|nr:hypothetical protein BG015_001701 [Linnemannia schmuckeri]
MITKMIQWSSVLNRKAATLAFSLHPKATTTDPALQSLLAADHNLGVVDPKHEIYSIDPVLTFFRANPDYHVLPMTDLARKLAWLLGLCKFMRLDVPVPRPKDDKRSIFPPLCNSAKPTTISMYTNTVSRLFALRVPDLPSYALADPHWRRWQDFQFLTSWSRGTGRLRKSSRNTTASPMIAHEVIVAPVRPELKISPTQLDPTTEKFKQLE